MVKTARKKHKILDAINTLIKGQTLKVAERASRVKKVIIPASPRSTKEIEAMFAL